MKKTDCCGAKLYEAYEDLPFPSHKKGEEKRRQIIEILRHEPNLSVGAIAERTRLSIDQVRRHRRTLVAMGLWNITAIAVAFFAGAYYAAPESVDEFVQDHIESRILHWEDEIKWNLQSEFIPVNNQNL